MNYELMMGAGSVIKGRLSLRLLCFSGVLTPSLRGRAGERLFLLVQRYKNIS